MTDRRHEHRAKLRLEDSAASVADVVAVVGTISDTALRQDSPERAHALEDQLFREVLVMVADGHPQSKRLAAAALAARDIPFDRWCR